MNYSIERLNEYERELRSCNVKSSESVFQRVADNYEDDLLEVDDFPAGYFEFVINLLSDEVFFSKPGLWHFLLVFSTESQKLKSELYKAMADCIILNYVKYNDADLCFGVCDFIARNYPHGAAVKILKDLEKIEEQKAIKGFAVEGLRILDNELVRGKR